MLSPSETSPLREEILEMEENAGPTPDSTTKSFDVKSVQPNEVSAGKKQVLGGEGVSNKTLTSPRKILVTADAIRKWASKSSR